MRRELLIGLIGVKGVGKSTVAEMLVELIPIDDITAWADALKEEVADFVEMMDWTAPNARPSRDEMERLKGQVYGPLCQGWGAYRRLQDPDYWIKAWDRRAPSRVVVPDTRHHNEADYIHTNGGILIGITGPSRWEGDTRSSAHESERHIEALLDKADHHLFNVGALDDLRGQVAMVIEAMKAGSRVGLAA
jgi:energy-coupling factor transporter ATP-binding protein EcfA2